jgi:hypothetical protein
MTKKEMQADRMIQFMNREYHNDKRSSVERWKEVESNEQKN